MNKRQIIILVIGSVLLLGLLVGYLSEINSLNLQYKTTAENSSALARIYVYSNESYLRSVEDTNQNYRDIGLLIVSITGILMFMTIEKNTSTEINESSISNNENQNENLEVSELKIKLKRLTDLKNEGILTEEEFETKKDKLMSEFI